MGDTIEGLACVRGWTITGSQSRTKTGLERDPERIPQGRHTGKGRQAADFCLKPQFKLRT